MTILKINLNDGSAEYQDSEGNRIEPKCEKCGGLADTWISGTESHIWMCNDCLYGKQEEAKFTYQTEWGSTMPIRYCHNIERENERR
jgi:hypothetical protein